MKRRRYTLLVAVTAMALMIFSAGTAAAATTMTVGFGGMITSTMNVNNGTTVGHVLAGSPYTGTVTLDGSQSPVPQAFGGGTRTVYAFTSMTFTIGSSTATSGPGSIDVFDNLTTTVGYPAGDSVYVNFTQGVANTMGVAPSGPLGGVMFNWMGLALLDSTGHAVSGGALPANLSSASFPVIFSEFNFGTLGWAWGAGNTSMIQGLSWLSTTSAVTPPPPPPPVAVAFAPSLPDGTVNAAYSASFASASGGTGGFTYSATGLPAGLSLGGTTVSGTPTTAGTFNVTLTATDSSNVSASASFPLTIVAAPPVVPCSGSNAVVSAYVARNPGFIVVNGGLNLLDHLWTTNLNPGNTTFLGGLVNWFQTGLVVSYTGTTDPNGCILDSLTVAPAVTVSTASLPTGTAGLAYQAPVSAAWGAAPYTVSVSGLPAGLSFDGTNIVGKPTVVGSFTVTVDVTDSVSATASQTLSLMVVDQPIAFAPALPAGTVGAAYSAGLTASGFGPFSFGAAGLPAGLVLSGNTISGTPTASGTFVVTLTAIDAAGASASAQVSLTIGAAATATPGSGSYTVKDEGQGKITAIDPNGAYLMVGSKKLIWNASTLLNVNTANGNRHVIDSYVKVGMRVQWKGLRDKATGTVLTSQLEVN